MQKTIFPSLITGRPFQFSFSYDRILYRVAAKPFRYYVQITKIFPNERPANQVFQGKETCEVLWRRCKQASLQLIHLPHVECE
ncbi:MAG: hypothetical protein BGN96_06990 [Bacteroidales bacterium 45-6]|nr:MAG: hypothetical protein BGN96_06990 [Bacteroidales bacterium 45-6]